jgi:hypothetical protein
MFLSKLLHVCQTLSETVWSNPSHYSLKHTNLIELYQLSRENYGDSVFIHPPLFPYTLALLTHGIGLPSPVVPVLFHIGTTLLLPLLTALVLQPWSCAPVSSTPASGSGGVPLLFSGSSLSASVWATLIFSICPIASFCSQRIWIDNAAMFVVTLSATIHLYLIRRCILSDACLSNIYVVNFVSGLQFGLLSLNCKITCLALLPFLLLWSAASMNHIASSRVNNQERIASRSKSVVIVLVCVLGGMVIGHGPWVALYYVSQIFIYFFKTLLSHQISILCQ